MIYSVWCIHTQMCICILHEYANVYIRSRRRLNLECLNLQIYQFSWQIFWVTGTLFILEWKLVWNFGDFCENVFDVYGDSRENLLEILAIGIILSPISSVCGHICNHICIYMYTFYSKLTKANAVAQMYIYICICLCTCI